MDNFRAAASLVSSRAFGVDDQHGMSLVPLADIFNHKVTAWDCDTFNQKVTTWHYVSLTLRQPGTATAWHCDVLNHKVTTWHSRSLAL